MIRRLSALVTASTALAAAAVVTAGGTAAADTPAADTPAAGCSSAVRVDGFAFDPPAVAPGGTSTATLSATNCTGSDLVLSELWSYHYVPDPWGPATPVCATITLARAEPIGAYGHLDSAMPFSANPSPCASHVLEATVSLSVGSLRLGTYAADLQVVTLG
jgi:hypothetical protein